MAKILRILYKVLQINRWPSYLTSRRDFIYNLNRLQFLARRTTRFVAAHSLSFLPLEIAMKLIGFLQLSQGFGVGHKISKSGEIGAIKTIFQGKELHELNFFDVGANRGEYTVRLLQLFPNCRIFAFEPSSTTFEMLKTNVQHNQVKLLNYGLAQTSGEFPLYKADPVSRISSLTPVRLPEKQRSKSRQVKNASDAFKEIVTIYRLDDIFPGFGLERIDLLKIDVEGHELDVLRGSKQLFEKRLIENIQFEVGEFNIDTKVSFRDIFEYLSQHDFTLSVIKHGKLIRLPTYKLYYEVYIATNFVAQLNQPKS